MTCLPFAPRTWVLSLFPAFPAMQPKYMVTVDKYAVEETIFRPKTLLVIHRSAVWAGKSVASEGKNDFFAVTQLAEVALSTAPLTVFCDVVKKNLVDLCKVSQ